MNLQEQIEEMVLLYNAELLDGEAEMTVEEMAEYLEVQVAINAIYTIAKEIGGRIVTNPFEEIGYWKTRAGYAEEAVEKTGRDLKFLRSTRR